MKDSISRVDNFTVHRFCQKLTRKDNRRLSRADNSAFLVYISILFLRENVNRTDDIPLPIVAIEKLRTSKVKCGEKVLRYCSMISFLKNSRARKRG